jgi:hypothetical protein
MPSCFLTCEGCGNRQSAHLDEAELAQLLSRKTLLKHCLVCRTTTEWDFAFIDRRSGHERRHNVERRGSSQ